MMRPGLRARWRRAATRPPRGAARPSPRLRAGPAARPAPRSLQLASRRSPPSAPPHGGPVPGISSSRRTRRGGHNRPCPHYHLLGINVDTYPFTRSSEARREMRASRPGGAIRGRRLRDRRKEGPSPGLASVRRALRQADRALVALSGTPFSALPFENLRVGLYARPAECPPGCAPRDAQWPAVRSVRGARDGAVRPRGNADRASAGGGRA